MGISAKLGSILYAEEEESEVFLGPSMSKGLQHADVTARTIGLEIRSTIDRNYQRTVTILQNILDILEAMKDALMKYETIHTAQIDNLMARQPVRSPVGWQEPDNQHSTPGYRRPHHLRLRPSCLSKRLKVLDSSHERFTPFGTWLLEH